MGQSPLTFQYGSIERQARSLGRGQVETEGYASMGQYHSIIPVNSDCKPSKPFFLGRNIMILQGRTWFAGEFISGMRSVVIGDRHRPLDPRRNFAQGKVILPWSRRAHKTNILSRLYQLKRAEFKLIYKRKGRCTGGVNIGTQILYKSSFQTTRDWHFGIFGSHPPYRR